MKVIELLNKIANGEEVPKKIKVYDDSFTYIDKWEQYTSDNTDKPLLYIISAFNYSGLNDKVEIIGEDKKIETIDPIDYCRSTDTTKDMVLVEKINEIIRFLYKTEKDK